MFKHNCLFAQSHNFYIVFNHFDGALMAKYVIFVLFILKSCLFVRMIHADIVKKSICLNALFNHLLG